MTNRRYIVITGGLRWLARSRRISNWALTARKVSTLLLGHRLTPTGIVLEGNGEGWLIEQLAPSTRAFVDVGANVGDWTAKMLAVAPGAKGVLFEPSAQAAIRLRDRFAEETAVEIVEAAVADRPGRAVFHEEPNCGETSSLLASNSASDATARDVPVVTIDDEMSRLGLDQLDVLKIDAEGYDLQVLRGSARALSERRIRIIQFEYNGPWAGAGSTLGAALDLLAGYGFETFLLRPDGLWTYDYGRLGELFCYSNFVALDATWTRTLRGAIRGPVL